MPLGSLESVEVALLTELPGFGVCSPTMVDVDDERLKVLASGARCVSLSSTVRQRIQWTPRTRTYSS